MIKHYYWPTPNGHKTAIMLEEVELEYEVCTINILEGDQFDPVFIAISPNNRMPAIVDRDTGGSPVWRRSCRLKWNAEAWAPRAIRSRVSWSSSRTASSSSRRRSRPLVGGGSGV